MKVVMYHYVRPLERSRYPAIHGRTPEVLRAQIQYLKDRHHICSPQELFACLAAGRRVPEEWVLLTFDDGYSDHFRYVWPILDEYGVSALFFVPVVVVRDRKMLDVNKIHFILSSDPSCERIMGRLDTLMRDFGQTDDQISSLRELYFLPNRFDGASTNFIKRVLQKGLPSGLRSKISSALFSEFVSVDEAAFAEELYVSHSECRAMVRAGQHFGSHGVSHSWMGEMDADAQAAEIGESVEFLKTIHDDQTMPVAGLAMCYPYGSYNSTTICILEKMGFNLAFSTKVGDADFSKAPYFELKRYDTCDIPG